MLLIVIGMLILLFSAPLGYETIRFVYAHRNLAEEFVSILEGIMSSYRCIGILLALVGLYKNEIINRRKKDEKK